MKRRFLLAILGLGVAAILSVPGVSSAATIVNGGFETGNFTGWTVVNHSGGSLGDWFIYSGTTPPLSFFPIATPPEGTHAAVTDQTGPGSHVLYQDVALEAGFKHTLSFDVDYNNRAGTFATPPSLDFSVFPNQQYRIDVLRPTAPVTSVAPGDVLATIFQTKVGDPQTLAPTPVASISAALPGQPSGFASPKSTTSSTSMRRSTT